METKPTCLIVNADELNRLVRENIALKKELACKSYYSCTCDHCQHSNEFADDCDAECGVCRLAEKCVCRTCDNENDHFEWRGIVPETEPTPEEEAELMNRLTARERGHTHD